MLIHLISEFCEAIVTINTLESTVEGSLRLSIGLVKVYSRNFEFNQFVKFFIQHILKLNLKLTCRAMGLSIIISDASLKALDALISPSAAMILALASLSASASAAIARCS